MSGILDVLRYNKKRTKQSDPRVNRKSKTFDITGISELLGEKTKQSDPRVKHDEGDLLKVLKLLENAAKVYGKRLDKIRGRKQDPENKDIWYDEEDQ